MLQHISALHSFFYGRSATSWQPPAAPRQPPGKASGQGQLSASPYVWLEQGATELVMVCWISVVWIDWVSLDIGLSVSLLPCWAAAIL